MSAPRPGLPPTPRGGWQVVVRCPLCAALLGSITATPDGTRHVVRFGLDLPGVVGCLLPGCVLLEWPGEVAIRQAGRLARRQRPRIAQVRATLAPGEVITGP